MTTRDPVDPETWARRILDRPDQVHTADPEKLRGLLDEIRGLRARLNELELDASLSGGAADRHALLTDLAEMHPVPWRIRADDHDVDELWDAAGGHVLERRCFCGERWTHDSPECPDDPGDPVLVDADGDAVSVLGIERVLAAAVNAYAQVDAS